MGYYIDLSKISLDQYKEKLKTKTLVPSHQILLNNIDKIIEYLKSSGIKNLSELQTTLKKKEKLIELSKANLLSEEYLKVLLREINSSQPKPNKFSDFIGISKDTLLKLEKNRIKNTLQLYENIMTPDLRKEFSEKTGINESNILELTKLTDLSRIKWVGHTFARVLYDSGYDTIDKITKADYETLYNKIKKLNEEKKLYKGHIGLNDMKILIEVSKDVEQEIEY